MLTAISNNEIGLNVLCEMIAGFIVPGKALAVNMFKAYGTLTLVQAIGFLDTLKIGHYVKIPPRAMFRAQIIPTLFSVIIVITVLMNLTLDVVGHELANRQYPGFLSP